jgi:hypothetical protein
LRRQGDCTMDEERSSLSVSSQKNRLASLRHKRSSFPQARQEPALESSSASSAFTQVRGEQSGHSFLSNTHGESSQGMHVVSQPDEWEANTPDACVPKDGLTNVAEDCVPDA